MTQYKAIIIIILFSNPNYLLADILFDSFDTSGGTISPLPTMNSLNDVDINFDALASAPSILTITLPANQTITVDLDYFNHLRGYEFRDEDDPPGPPVYIIPGFPLEHMSYTWKGGNDNWDVLITVTRGVLYGLITNSQKRYGITKTIGNQYSLVDYNLSAFRPLDGGNIGNLNPNKNIPSFYQVPFDPYKVTTGVVKEFNVPNENQLTKLGSNGTVIDVLIMWTEDSRIDAGGDPFNVNDTEDIDALMVAGIEAVNTTLRNSQADTRVTKFYTSKLLNFNYAGNQPNPPPDPFAIDLENFKNLPSVQQLRNDVGADMVTGIISPSSAVFNVCGVAYAQTYPTCSDFVPDTSCNFGNNFDDFAYTLVVQECVLWSDAYTHEVGHLLGANHLFSELDATFRADVVNNGFPDAFAYKTSGFTSMMSNTDVLSRDLHFSNPNAAYNNITTGVTGSSNNTFNIDSLSPTVANFRTRPDLIFENGFE